MIISLFMLMVYMLLVRNNHHGTIFNIEVITAPQIDALLFNIL